LFIVLEHRDMLRWCYCALSSIKVQWFYM
jgi:hypothetical protein